MGALWKIITDNGAIIMMAPALFLAALALGWLAGWIVVRLVYNQRLAHQQDMITNLRAVLEEKLPVSSLPPIQRKRSKQMSFGLILIFVGLGAALLGAIIVSFDKSAPPQQANVGSSGAATKNRGAKSHNSNSGTPISRFAASRITET